MQEKSHKSKFRQKSHILITLNPNHLKYEKIDIRRNVCLKILRNTAIRKQRRSGLKFQLLLRQRKQLSKNDFEILKSLYGISAITRLKYNYKLTVSNQTAYRFLIENGDIMFGHWPNTYAVRTEPYKVG